MRERRDIPQKPTLSAGENYARAERLIASNWLPWIALLYMPFGMSLAFGIGPVRSLLGLPPTLEVVVFEVVLWVGAPLALGILVHYRLTARRARQSEQPEVTPPSPGSRKP